MKLFKVFTTFSIFCIVILIFLLISCSQQRSIPGLEGSSRPLNQQRRARSHSNTVGSQIKTKYSTPKQSLSIGPKF